MMDNIYLKIDPACKIKSDKEKSTNHIDGAVALVMVLGRVMRNEKLSSVYDKRGILIL